MDIALDIGGTKLAAARVRQGEIVEQRTTPTPGDDPDGLIRALVDLCDGWISEAAVISKPVSLGTPFPLAKPDALLVSTPSSPTGNRPPRAPA